MATIELESMAVAMPEVAGHPNRRAFRGVLTVVDVASQRSPTGANGHLVLLTKRAAEAALPSLLGMALDYAPTFDRHDVRRKVGVITRAEVVGRNLELSGYLFAKDFPEIVDEIAKAGRRPCGTVAEPVRGIAAGGETIHGAIDPSWSERHGKEGSGWKSSLVSAARQILTLTTSLREVASSGEPPVAAAAVAAPAELGMSYEVTNVELADKSARIWRLTRVVFTGAAILRRDKAAYQDTWIELSI